MNSPKHQTRTGTGEPGGRSGHMKHRSFAAGAPLAVIIAACSPGGPETLEGDASATVGGDGSEISLEPVTDTDLPDIFGTLGCSFTTTGGELLLVAKADVGDEATPSAAINNNGYGEALRSPQTGGFGTLEKDGARFGGRGLTITLTTGEPSGEDMSEVTTRAAEMLVQRGDGAERTYQGDWSCGP